MKSIFFVLLLCGAISFGSPLACMDRKQVKTENTTKLLEKKPKPQNRLARICNIIFGWINNPDIATAMAMRK